MSNNTPQIGQEQDGYRYIGGDPSSQNSWEPSDLKIGAVEQGYKFKGGDPAKKENWEPYKPSSQGIIRKAADLGLGFASGATGAIKSIADIAGADNPVSDKLERADKGIKSYLSDQAIADSAEQQAILKETSGKGFVEGAKAAVKAFGVAPVQTMVQGAGSIVPTALAALATGGASLPVSIFARVATGVAQGVGGLKGGIYDDVKQRTLEAGATPQEAEAAAVRAQEYSAENASHMAASGLLGAADAATGVNKVAAQMPWPTG
jgi:hypothetical protein